MGKIARLNRRQKRNLRVKAKQKLIAEESTQPARPEWQWRARPEGSWHTVEVQDKHAGFRAALNHLAQGIEEWAGIPMPIEGEELVVNPTYPWAELWAKKHEPEPDEVVLNMFYSHKWRSDLIIGRKGGKLVWGFKPAVHSLRYALQTLGCSEAWGIEQEHAALQLLATKLRHHQFKQYLLAGMFLETSKRSGLTYLFRKLRPTVVILTKPDEECRILCSLCMHPIAYYAGSWAGAMCPTDDVLAHLMLMRGDEHMLWRRSNQHAPHRPEAGL